MIQKVPALVVEPFDVTAHEQMLANTLKSKDTRVFLDTSTLVWLYRLHDAARKEMIVWLTEGPQAGNVRIPRRALLEFARHRRSQNVLLPFKQQVARLPSLMGQVEQWAHLITDDALAKAVGYASRADYLAALKATVQSVQKVTAPFKQQTSLPALDAELVPLFNQLALDTDIYCDIADMQREYEARSEIRMPPGFEDLAKARKAEHTAEPDEDGQEPPALAGVNRFGDYAIWQEIVQYCRAQGAPADILILTHDQKRDWCYTPLAIVDDENLKPRSNPKGPLRVTAPHPLLAHEARLHAQAPSLFIVTTPQLASVVSRHSTGASLIELARAVQIEVKVETEAQAEAETPDSHPKEAAVDRAAENREPPLDAAPADDEAAQNDEARPEPEGPAAVGDVDRRQGHLPTAAALQAFFADVPHDARADRVYDRDVDGSEELDLAIQQLRSYSWYTQNPATDRGLTALRKGGATLKQGFVFGRNLYQAACGSAGSPISVLENLDADLGGVPDPLAAAVYAGALFEAYFNKDGGVRREPKSKQITALFSAQTAPRLAPAVAFLREQLREYEDHYLLLPDAGRPVITLDLVEADGTITGIRRGDIELTSDLSGEALASPLPVQTSYERLRDRIARHFALPKTQFLLRDSFEDVRPLSAGELIAWGPTTDVVFPAP